MTRPLTAPGPLLSDAGGGSWSVGARSETGYVRKANEDRMAWVRSPFGDIFIVSDGMGGYKGGARAAELTVATLQTHLIGLSPLAADFMQQVQQAFQAANRAVHSERHANDPNTREMGATGVAAIVCGSQFAVAHVGDSRVYHWRRGLPLLPRTRDHTRVQGLVDAQVISAAEAERHPDNNLLERAIGHQPTVQADVSRWIDLRHGDRLLLCSDGLSGYVSDAEIEAILKRHGDPQRATDELVECALAKGGEDNVTVQVAQFNLPWRRRLGALAWPALALVGLVTVLVFMLYRPKSGPQASASAASAAPAAAGASAATSVPAPASAAPPWEPQQRRGL